MSRLPWRVRLSIYVLALVSWVSVTVHRSDKWELLMGVVFGAVMTHLAQDLRVNP